ncbi:MAG TPA: FHA domain-containing protein [Kiritimatiellae bacterium]|nr:FHA domain-containing protein [Kiritimatiellia bacterium]
MSWIEIERHAGSGAERIEVGDGIVIGRSAECDVVLDDPSVSAKHAWIRPAGGRYVIIDLRSTNGVTLNGHAVDEALLRDGDRLTFGDVAAVYRDPHDARRVDRPRAGTGAACPRCGHGFVTWGSCCPVCGLRFDFEDTSSRHRTVVRVLSSLAFAGGLAGPLLLGIGWMLGIVLGVMVISGYREESEDRDLVMARRGILLGLLWMTVGVWLLQTHLRAR